MRFDKCVVCGAPSVGRTGYVYLANGKTVVGMPFCQQHLDEAGIIIANPVFENEQALRLFKEKHPGKYMKYVKDKRVIFINSKTKLMDDRKV